MPLRSGPLFLTPDKMSEAKGLIDARELDSAEKIIVAEMMTAPRDADWITLLAQVRLGQNRTPEALKLLDDANQIAGITSSRAMLISLAESQAGHMDRPSHRSALRFGWILSTPRPTIFWAGCSIRTIDLMRPSRKPIKPFRLHPALFEPMKIWGCAMKESTIWQKLSAGISRRSIGRLQAKIRPSGRCLIWLR